MRELVSGGLLERIPYLPQVLSRPSWLAQFLMDGGLPRLPNVVVPGKGPLPLVNVAAALAESAVTWADLRWIRELWQGPIVVKGVLTGMDGGVRRGADIVKALCLGAGAVLCGRAYAYGLAAAGEAGVARAIEILKADVERTLRLLGCTSVQSLDRSYVNVPKGWD